MLRTTLAGLGAATLIGTTLVTGALTPVDAADGDRPDWGTTRMDDFTLKPGCHRYPFRYRITAPTDEWSAELFLINPNGRNLAGLDLDTNSDADQGTRSWLICRPSTVYGKHVIKMKITWTEGKVNTDGYVPNSNFRFTRP